MSSASGQAASQGWNCRVPVVSGFYGIAIVFYWEDHLPPHFHAKYAGEGE